MSAAGHNELGVLRWALEHGCRYREEDIRVCVVDPEFLEWFESNKTTFREALSRHYWSDGSSDDDSEDRSDDDDDSEDGSDDDDRN